MPKKKTKCKPRSSANTGRDREGKFTEGNQLSVGNIGKSSEKAKALKKALLEAITEEDIEDIGKKLVEKAKGGDVPSAKELFDRMWGRAKQELDVEHRISEETATLLGLIDGSSKGILPSEGEKDV